MGRAPRDREPLRPEARRSPPCDLSEADRDDDDDQDAANGRDASGQRGVPGSSREGRRDEDQAEYAERFGLLNLYEYLARNDVTWNPEIVSAVEYSLFCPTTEEYILPITHGNDRVEWFLLLNG